MTISIWRYCHLLLALISGLYLVLASVTGLVLALEPIQDKLGSPATVDLSGVCLAETIAILNERQEEVLGLKVDKNGSLVADIVVQDGSSASFFVDPFSGDILGKPSPQHPIFRFATNLHRSLFLKSVGRVMVALVSLILCLMAVTGLLLIAKRQGGWLNFFSKVNKDGREMWWHVVLGRWTFIPILIVAITGVYLSAEKFSLLPTSKITHGELEPNDDVGILPDPSELGIFKEIKLDELRSLTFPFSEFPEDYFEISLKSKQLLVDQYSGKVLSEKPYPFTFLANELSMLLHTGQGSIIWSIVLLVISLAILYFVYSGLVMWQTRIRSFRTISQSFDKDSCSHIILVGSETGSTFSFAKDLQRALVECGKKVFLTQINDYSTYQKAEHLVFMTSTYGDGEAPSNATNISKLLDSTKIVGPLKYSVLGFGSKGYSNFCGFAVEIENMLTAKQDFEAVMPLFKINDRSTDAFKQWGAMWGRKTGTRIQLGLGSDLVRKSSFQVVDRSAPNVDDTFLLRLKPTQKNDFQSGDLWEFIPEADGKPRLYSVAKNGGDVLLSIKRHEYGVCSSYLGSVSTSDLLEGRIVRNPEFHFPHKAKKVIMIANGTGMAPFLGMLNDNTHKVPVDLYWGGRTKISFEIYRRFIDSALESKKLNSYHLAFSRETGQQQYVQDLFTTNGSFITKDLNAGAVIMICGSLKMQKGVLQVLENLCKTNLNKPLSEFEKKGQLKTDCY